MKEEIPIEFVWSAAQIMAEVDKHRNDFEWNPHELEDGGYVVKTFEGELVPAPNKQKE